MSLTCSDSRCYIIIQQIFSPELQRETFSDTDLSLSPSLFLSLTPTPAPPISGLAWLLPLLDENGPLCISVAVSQKDHSKSLETFSGFCLMFDVFFFFSLLLRFIYSRWRVSFGHKSSLQTCSCSQFSSGSTTCHCFCT